MPQYLYWLKGESPKPLEEFVRDRNGRTPILHWIELRPARVDLCEPGPVKDFCGLNFGSLSTGLPLPIEEMRLFREKRMLHVVAQDRGCRWFECTEDIPHDSGGWNREEINREEYEVVLLQDNVRFGLGNVHIGKERKVRIIEYWKECSVFAWRLILEQNVTGEAQNHGNRSD